MINDSTYGQVLHLPKRKALALPDMDVLASKPVLSDVFTTGATDPAAVGFVLSLLPVASGPVLWVQDYMSRRENGHLYTPALKSFGVAQDILQVRVSHPRDVLWAMEEGAGCASLSAVIGEIHGGPAVLDFTATKRLSMRAQVSGVPVYLIRSGDPGGLSAARMRWRAGSLPSLAHPYDSHSPGRPQWDVNLFRARGYPPGRWVARYDPDAARTADRLGLVPRSGDGALDTGDQPVSNRTAT
ncbi:hypothetical protein OS189_01215 [Sulfitobacter sp. F26169L]|nr:hypothetical protein [Sulfitobacter sp. F26169L]MCX7564960.1 hypothetical protein [Sulfitobacter sp. F26169L]